MSHGVGIPFLVPRRGSRRLLPWSFGVRGYVSKEREVDVTQGENYQNRIKLLQVEASIQYEGML